MLKHKPYNEFKGSIRAKGLTYYDVAESLGISYTALSHKINGQSDFYLGEVEKLNKTYGIDHRVFLT